MKRILFCIFAVLFCGVARAQSPAAGTASSTAAPGVMSTESPEVTQFQKLEDAWSTAVNAHDQYGLENVLSPLFVDVAANGDITTRNQQVVQVITGEDKTIHLTQKVITVRMLGDIAVANGTYALHHKVGTSEEDEKGVFTHVFERLRGGWACINSQRTLVQENAGQKGKGKKPSTTEEPFHFPFLGH